MEISISTHDKELSDQYYERHYPNIFKALQFDSYAFDKIIQNIDYNTIDDMEYTFDLLEGGKITIDKNNDYTIAEGIDNQRVSMDSIHWMLGVIDTEDLLENMNSNVKKSPQEQEKKSMKERLDDAQKKANHKNDQTKEHSPKDRMNQIL